MSTSVTVADLRSAAERLRAQADELDSRANKAEEALSGVDALLNGNFTPSTTAKRKGKPGRPAGSKNKKQKEAASAPAEPATTAAVKVDGRTKGNKTSLKTLISEILKKNKLGLTLQELVRAVMAEGYKSKAKSKFGQIVYQNLYKLMYEEHTVAKDKDSKKYRLKAAA